MTASSLVSFGIPALALIVAAFFAALFWAVTKKLWPVIAVIGWLIATALIASSGVLLRFDLRPPPMALMFVVIIGGALLIARSTKLAALPMWLLIAFQTFRLPL